MKKVLTILFDGLSIQDNNVPSLMPTFNRLWEEYPHSSLVYSGEKIGMPENCYADKKLVHKLLGAGKNIKQDHTVVNDFLNENYKTNEEFQSILEQKDQRIHILTTISDSASKGNVEDTLKLYSILVNNGLSKVCFHIIIDCVDNHDSVLESITKLNDEINKRGMGKLCSFIGKNYVYDNSKNQLQTAAYYDLIIRGIGESVLDFSEIVTYYKDNNMNLNELKPIVLDSMENIRDKDIVLWFNYSSDVTIPLFNSFKPNFKDFPVLPRRNARLYSLFYTSGNVLSLINKDEDYITLGKYLAGVEKTTSRIGVSTSIKYLTNYFDNSASLENCKREEVVTNSKSAINEIVLELTKKASKAMTDDLDFIVLDYTGIEDRFNIDITTRLKLFDRCLSALLKVAEDNFYKVIVLSVGNGVGKLPLIITDSRVSIKEDGIVNSFAPTLLQYLEIAIPSDMQETEVLM